MDKLFQELYVAVIYFSVLPNNNQVFKSHHQKMNIESYFKVLTEDDIEQRELMVKKAVIFE